MTDSATSPAPQGELFVLSAPSGTGKTSLLRAAFEGPLAELEALRYAVSHTTRRRRRDEVDGGDYHFVSRQAFEQKIEAGAFLEWQEVYAGRLYGTSRQEVVPHLDAGVDVIVDIDVRGAEQVLREHPQAHGIFMLPPGFEALRRRLVDRDLDSPEDIRNRLALSVREVEKYPLYEYVIINQDLQRAAESLAAIILARRHRLPRAWERARAVLQDFERAFRAAGAAHGNE